MLPLVYVATIYMMMTTSTPCTTSCEHVNAIEATAFSPLRTYTLTYTRADNKKRKKTMRAHPALR